MAVGKDSAGNDIISGQDGGLDPVLTYATQGPSPQEERVATITRDQGIQRRLAQADAAGPTVRQRTQSETIDLMLLQRRLGNPFSTRWIPFEQLRDMTTDLMLAFGWWMTIGPLVRADFYFECVAEGEQVIMADGTLKNVEEVRAGDLVLSSNEDHICPDLVERSWCNGERPVFKITLSNGRTLRVTANHPVRGWDSWIPAGDLRVGDVVTFAKHTPPQDSEATKDDAFVLAFWLAEGSKGSTTYEVACQTELLPLRLKEIAERRGWGFRHDPLLGRCWMPNGHRRNANSPMNFLRKHGAVEKTKNIRIPDSIMSAPNDVVAEFIGTYIACDGMITHNGVKIVSISERMVRDFQVLFSRLGVQASVTVQRREAFSDLWAVQATSLEALTRLRENGVYIYHKHEDFLRVVERTQRNGEATFPPQSRELIHSGPGMFRRAGMDKPKVGAWITEQKMRSVADLEDNHTVDRLLKSGLGWAAVTKIEEDGISRVYDMTCASSHAFFLEGALVHNCSDAQIAAAVDEAYRQIHVELLLSMSNDLWYGHQPLVKQFKLGRLGSTYRDPNAKDPNQDLPVWSSSADALLWKPPAVLNPSHCLPMWDDNGQMVGFKFSNVPIPHFDLISAASAYGYLVIPGHEINADYAVWPYNEGAMEFNNIFGAARTKRAYPAWWSYWFRWHIADRAYENLADPPKYVYYPVDFDEFIDPDDPNQTSPQVRQARQTAIEVGEQMRSGATIAFPGSFAEGMDGRGSAVHKWQAGYFEPPNNFSDLDANLRILDIYKLRAWFTPEQAVVEGAGNRTSGGSAGGTGGARMASQLADVHEQSQQPLVARYDSYINDHFIPQFIAANFPEKIGTPCQKVTRSLGQADDQVLSQVLTLIGQVRGEVLPVDIRALLEQLNIPLLNRKQMQAEIQEISKLAKIMGPSQQDPTPRGTQGYNAGVGARPDGSTFYYDPPQRIVLAESGDFMGSLPDTPHFKDPAARAQVLKLRQAMKKRYEEQYQSLAEFLRQQPTLHLAEQKTKNGLNEDQAAASAAAIISAWAASQAPGAHAGAKVVTEAGLGKKLAGILTKIALAGGKSTLKGARLHAEDFNETAIDDWVNDRVKYLLNSVDETVRDEAREWLAQELQKSINPDVVADAAKEHFSEFPLTHSERVARTENAEAFNHGTLEACDRAGVSQVQVHDASDGNDTRTDSVCQQRNGRIVSVQEARGITLAHPRCTLGFSPLSTEDLSIEHVESLPEHLADAGRHVAYDGESETLYLDAEVDAESELAVMLMLGRDLALR